MKEYIEKEAALDAFCPMCIYKPVCLATPIDYPCRALTALNAQVADVKPVVRGEWIRLGMHCGEEQFKCSVCEMECYVPECMYEPMYAFCPNCGADMRGESHE